jgi:hypothetical protein
MAGLNFTNFPVWKALNLWSSTNRVLTMSVEASSSCST